MTITPATPDDVVLTEIGARFAAARLALNFTQTDLAERAGVSRATVERLEAGAVATRLATLVRVCRALGLIDRIETLAPAPGPSPIDMLQLKGRRRRASKRKVNQTRETRWKWGDEA